MLVKNLHCLAPLSKLLSQSLLASIAKLIDLGEMRPADLAVFVLTQTGILENKLDLEVIREPGEVFVSVLRTYFISF